MLKLLILRSLQNYKSELASKDEMNVLHLSSLYTALFVFDNLNKVTNFLVNFDYYSVA